MNTNLKKYKKKESKYLGSGSKYLGSNLSFMALWPFVLQETSEPKILHLVTMRITTSENFMRIKWNTNTHRLQNL